MARPADDNEESRPKKRRGGPGLPADVPRVYVHKGCKSKTEMPAEVIQEYLENPFEMGEEPTTWCNKCDQDVAWQDCYWAETRQNLYEYIDDVRAEMVLSGNDPRPGKPDIIWWAPVGFGIGLGVVGGLIAMKENLSVPLIGLAGVVGGAVLGAGWMVKEYYSNRRDSEEWNRNLLKRYYKRHPEAKARKGRKRTDADAE
jgi:hypothetical protein